MDWINICNSELFETLALIVGAPIVPCMILSYPIIGRQFDPMIVDPAFPDFWMGPLGKYIVRPIGYTLLIVANVDWEKARERRRSLETRGADLGELYVRTYGHVDYRKQASWLQLLFSILYISSLMVGAVFGLLLAFCGNA
ncbi:hypothetical protein [Salicola sp. Rm-C-2C1-2]|uniref:hypothetical protein n=1 Tax=Salicola sp. Rm-C-2C1-2 TaxID=3141321 RepID=UPI0032E4EDC7